MLLKRRELEEKEGKIMSVINAVKNILLYLIYLGIKKRAI